MQITNCPRPFLGILIVLVSAANCHAAEPASFAEMRAIWDRQPPRPAKSPAKGSREEALRRAEINSRQAAEAFFRSRRFIDGWLKRADAKTDLISRNLNRNRDLWNAQGAAADNYPFMVITAHMTDRPLFEGRMLDMLRTETRLTCRIGRMPDDWSFSKQDFVHAKPNLGKIIFGSSEYCKDGLLAVTEWLGPCPWTDRMLGILDDLWKHAPVETPRGNIPSTSTEINGEMLQVLLIFDIPRHQSYLKLPIDYPRLNQFPEWFTVAADKQYTVRNLPADSHNILTGQHLRNGLPVALKPGSPVELIVRK